MCAQYRKPPRLKIQDNLFKVGHSYYYIKGKFEQSLGKFKNDQAACDYKKLFESQLDIVGRSAFRWKAKDAWLDYFAERKKEDLSQATIIEMQSIWLKHLAKHFGGKRLSDIDDVMWNRVVKKFRIKDPTNPKKVLKTFLTWCQSTGKVRFVPNLEVPTQTRRKRKVLNENQIKAILSNSHDSLLLFVAMYLFMGVRWSEQLRMRWDNINLKDGFLLIEKSTSRTRKERETPINAFVLQLLLKRLDHQISNDICSPFVFPKRGRPDEHMVMTGPMKAWDTMLKKSGLEDSGILPHDLRATYEHFMHLDTGFTDTQREKMVGASVDIQRRIYLTGMRAKHLKGLEEVVQFEGLEKVVADKLSSNDLHDKGIGKSTERFKTKRIKERAGR